jgi:hypothetical protein
MTASFHNRDLPPVSDEPDILHGPALAAAGLPTSPTDPVSACRPDLQPAGGGLVSPAGDHKDLVEKLDTLVAAATEPENTVLTDDARLVRWTGPVFALFSMVLLPWTIYLAVSLPSRQISPDYDTAWAGFDVMLLAALAGTAWFALRRSRYLSTAATATAVLLIVDAWFDVMTTPSGQRTESILLAAAVELPLASVCLWLSYHTHQVAERRIVLLLRRQGHRRRRRAGTPDHHPADRS